ncbi:hypothetical protein D3870_16970 [Noviherbaspirillum cavernae]|uniref:Lipoprotein n=1 Tax=Noviherbaspirillum cavernae TaxID=2320862 RepID=A0A418X4V3_9BURK|nr:hypothetical protein [Noviherbaspirillum cavernae]RJG07460.1 hypothetical protein D3870_16970 [Noviherbaspirillum cavernae]
MRLSSLRFLLLAMAAASVIGCGEIDQAQSASNTNRGDTPAWKGAKDPFVAKGWTPGDKASWESQMRTRSLNQNEYVRTN